MTQSQSIRWSKQLNSSNPHRIPPLYSACACVAIFVVCAFTAALVFLAVVAAALVLLAVVAAFGAVAGAFLAVVAAASFAVVAVIVVLVGSGGGGVADSGGDEKGNVMTRVHFHDITSRNRPVQFINLTTWVLDY